MIRAQIQIVGLDKVRRMSAQAPRVLDSELRGAVREGAVTLRAQAVDNARKFALDSKFPQSIRYQVSSLTALIGSMAASALSIEQGRRVGEVVKIGLIRRWIERKGLVRGIFSIQTQRVARRLSAKRRTRDNVDEAELRLAASIVEQIRRHGTKPHAFLIPAVEQSKRKVQDRFKKAVDVAVHRIVGRAA